MANAEDVKPGDTKSEKSTVCFGRYLVDLPKGADYAFGFSEFALGKIIKEPFAGDKKEFVKKMEARETELKTGENNDNYDKYIKTIKSNKDSDFWVFVTNRDVHGTLLYKVEAFRLFEGSIFHMKANPYGKEQIDHIVDILINRIFKQLHTRDNSYIPTEPGFCMHESYIVSDGKEADGETTDVSFYLKKWPDVSINISTSVMFAQEPYLLERIRGSLGIEVLSALFSGVKNIRRGHHNVGPIEGEESLDLVPSEAGYKTHNFMWESHWELENPLKPALTVTLTDGGTVGEPMRPSISDKDAVALFDAIVNSIRIRPTSPGKTSEAEPVPQAPSGQARVVIASGKACPHTGWWMAPDGGEIEGGNRRYVREGEPMPKIKLLGEASLWQKLKGERPSFVTETFWHQVEQEDKGVAQAPAAPTAGSKPGEQG